MLSLHAYLQKQNKSEALNPGIILEVRLHRANEFGLDVK